MSETVNEKINLLLAFGSMKTEAALSPEPVCSISFGGEDEDGDDKNVKVLDLDLSQKFDAARARAHQEHESLTREAYQKFEGHEQPLAASGKTFTDALDTVFALATRPNSVVEVSVSGGGGLMGEWTNREYYAFDPAARNWVITKDRPKTLAAA